MAKAKPKYVQVPLPTQYRLRRALVVILEPGLHVSRWNGIALNIRTLPGVTSVTDLGGISRETLDLLVGPDQPGS